MVRRLFTRLGTVALVASLFVFGVVAFAFAETTTTAPPPEDVVGGAAETLFDSLIQTAIQVLPYAAGLAALFIGWRIVRRFMK